MGMESVLENKCEPVAIVGIGCRFPGGVRCPRSFWKLLSEGTDAITEVPPDRWDVRSFYDANRDTVGKVYTRSGGFLEDIGLFDPQFFGISPREAAYMDPQQRLLLETTWEALEDGGLPPEKLAGSSVGVFVGLFMHDYENIHNGVTERRLIGPHSATGMSATISANRISYVFDFKGPSIVVDTACSSSLVAVHLACQSLMNGESELALAGGVNILIRPEMTMVLCKGSFLSPDGRCKSFDARADGYTRSEGVGMVALKRLSRAIEDGDRIYALIRGSAVNQDGRSEGITVPNTDSQIRVIRDALGRSGKSPTDIQYVEAHGTGTIVGDPFEARALGTVFSDQRSSDHPLIIGSVKTNFGHTESTAGIAGVIKTSLMLEHGQVPPSLHFETPNPQIDFDTLKLRVPTSLEQWPPVENGTPVCAGVNSFGFGGTNAHVILERYEEPDNRAMRRAAGSSEGEDGKVTLIPISAHSSEALRAIAVSYAGYTKSAEAVDVSLSDIAYTAALRKGLHAHRLTVAARSKEEFAGCLEAFEKGERRPGVASGQAVQPAPSKPAFVFSGMGQQWPQMGRMLIKNEPVFREALVECDELLRRHTTEWTLLESLDADEEHSRFSETQIAQPCIFSIQVALAALWRSWGITPATVIGHSVGEIAAIHVAGILSIEDAMLLCFHRSRLQQLLTGRGTMLAIGLSFEDAETLVDGFGDSISIAAINGPSNVTLSGRTTALQEIAQRLEKNQVFYRFLRVTVPFHSAVMDEISEEFGRHLEGITPHPAKPDVVSTVTGESVDWKDINVSYWLRNLRQPVRFAPAIGNMIKSGHDLFLEISAHPVLAAPIRDCLSGADATAFVLPSLRRNEPDDVSIAGALGQLYTTGYPIEWERLYGDRGRLVNLPTYPWQREYYWTESEDSREMRQGKRMHAGSSLVGSQVHPLLGGRLNTAAPTWNAEIGLSDLPYLRDHVVQNSIVYPAAAYLETALAAGYELFDDGEVEARDIEFTAPLLLSEENVTTVQVTADRSGTFALHSNDSPDNGTWALHTRGRLITRKDESSPQTILIDDIRKRCTEELSGAVCYDRFRAGELAYGPCFQGIESVWLGEGEALGRINIDGESTPDMSGYHLYPVILDSSFQVMAAIDTRNTYLPVGVERLFLRRNPGSALWCHARLTIQTDALIEGDITLFDDNGNIVAEIHRLRCRYIRDSQGFSSDSIAGILYGYEWILDYSHSGSDCSNSGFLPAPADIAGLVRQAADGFIVRNERRRYYEAFLPEIDALCTRYIFRALEQLGMSWEISGSFTTDELVDRLDILPDHRRLLGRMLAILEEDGFIAGDGDTWRVTTAVDTGDPGENWRRLVRDFPAFHAELTLLGKCGSRLDELLRGKEDPLSIIFAPGSTIAEHLYQNSPTFSTYNIFMQLSVGSIVDRLPESRPLRILEIGAGTGALTTFLLPLFPAHRTQYIFTDLSGAFLNQAEQKFRGYDFLEYQTLDIEKDPLSQGFEPHSFDLILAANVIHATSVLRNTLLNVKTLLSPGGLLLLLEINDQPRWYDLVYGFLPGWWLFADTDIRPRSPMLAKHEWTDLLESLDFVETAGLPESEDGHEPDHSIIIARRGTAATENISPDERTRPSSPDAEHIQSETIESPEPEKPRCWIVLADEGDSAGHLAAFFEERNITPVIVTKGDTFEVLDDSHITINPASPDEYTSLIETILPDSAVTPSIVSLWGAFKSKDGLDTAEIERMTNGSCTEALYLVQAIMNRQWTTRPDLWLVTTGSQTAGDNDDLDLTSAPLWGFGRVMTTELSNLQVRMVDLSPDPSRQEISRFVEELLSPDREDEIALRGDYRYVNRLVRQAPTGFHGPPDIPYRLHASQSKGFDGFTFVEADREKPGAGKVAIEVHAAGINFKDVAKVAGLLDEAALERSGLPDHLGMECSGIVVDVGGGVGEFSVGDEVMGIVLNCFANYVVTDPRALVKKPPHMSFEEAATVPLVFLAVYYALHELAGIRKGDRVLIHTAAGGVGLAALQVAQAAGAEIFATAGTSEKRDYLRELGVPYVGDSRTLSFADEIQGLIGSEGIDIVLNTLPSNTIETSSSLLKPVCGRFIDIGNVYERSLAVYGPDRGVSFHSFALENMIMLRPDLVGSLLRKVADRFEEKTYHALPHRVYPLAEIADAFRTMRKGGHIGKFVVSVSAPGVAPVPNRTAMTVRTDGTYLITGGLGGFGLATARWLVSCGARHLVLLGRSGASTPAAREAVKTIEHDGATVVVERCDVTRADQVRLVLDRIGDSMPPLRGVIHAAMVLDDISILKMKASQLRKVINPKILGAWNLHVSTLNSDLDFFICFSSFAAFVGNADQGNYIAGNLFLEALAHYRSARGLPAMTVNWGAIGEAGYVARHDEIKNHFRRQGINVLSLDQAWKIMTYGVEENLVHVGASPTNWQTMSRYSMSVARSPRFSWLVRQREDVDTGSEEARETLSAKTPPDERKRILIELVSHEVSRILGIPTEKLDISQPIDSLGFDSLMAVELVVAVESLANVKISKMTLLRPGLTMAGVAEIVDREIIKKDPRASETVTAFSEDETKDHAGTVSPADGEVTELAGETIKVDDLSDEDVDSMLSSLLSEGDEKDA